MSKFSGKICTAYCTCVYRRVQMYTSIRDEYVSYFVAANTALGTGMRRLDLPQQCDGRDAFSAEKERCVCVCMRVLALRRFMSPHRSLVFQEALPDPSA